MWGFYRRRVRLWDFRSSASLALFVLASSGCGEDLAAQCPQLVWADEFDGASLDTSKWEAQIGDGCDIGLCGWGNNELQWYLAENAVVGNGLLKITAKMERVRSRAYTSARLRTKGLADFTFGRFEGRVKLPRGQGLWPAFWMLPTEEFYGTWPQSGEIDIMESRGIAPNIAYGTIHFGEPFPDNRFSGGAYLSPAGDLSDAFHVFAIEWEPGEIRWYVDDTLYSRKIPDDLRGRLWPFDRDFHFLANVAVGGTFVGDPDDSIFPRSMEIDYVRVYDKARPTLKGEFFVPQNASGVAYSVENASGTGATFDWSVPPGATIVSGQGTASITVDWGTSGGDVSLQLSTSCGSQSLAMPVAVEAPQSLDFTFEDFETSRNLTLTFASGTLVENDSNPDPSGANTSAVVGEYTRNPDEKFDVLVYASNDIPDAGPFLTGSHTFHMDVFSSAPPGTEILVQLENSAVADGSNFPDGRHSTYLARTGVQNEWEHLRFDFNGRLDGNTSDNSVDTIVVLFDSGWDSGDVYHFDNFARFAAGGGSGGCVPASLHVSAISLGTENAGQGNKRGRAEVTLVDDCGGAASGALVAGTFSGDFNESASATSDAAGTAILVTEATLKGSVSFAFCVDSASHPTLSYNPADNVATCDSF